MTTSRRWARRLGMLAATVALLAGCGGSSAPSDDVPALGDSLDRVDDAIVDGRYDDARSELDELMGTTTTARDNGDLETAEADRILAAAAEVMSALPAEEPEPEPSEPAEPDPTESETAEPEPSPEDTDEDAEKEQEELEKEQEKLEKEQEKLEEDTGEGSSNEGDDGGGNGGDDGGGNGDSSENGPDDGEGS